MILSGSQGLCHGNLELNPTEQQPLPLSLLAGYHSYTWSENMNSGFYFCLTTQPTLEQILIRTSFYLGLRKHSGALESYNSLTIVTFYILTDGLTGDSPHTFQVKERWTSFGEGGGGCGDWYVYVICSNKIIGRENGTENFDLNPIPNWSLFFWGQHNPNHCTKEKKSLSFSVHFSSHIRRLNFTSSPHFGIHCNMTPMSFLRMVRMHISTFYYSVTPAY